MHEKSTGRPTPFMLSLQCKEVVLAKVIWQKATSLGSCRYLLACHVMSCHGCHLDFDQTGNRAIRYAEPENPNIEMDPITRCGVMVIRNSTYDERREGRKESTRTKERCWFPAVCYRMSVTLKSTLGGSLLVKILEVFPFE